MNVRRRVLEPAEGVTKGIGFYLTALDEIRKATREEVASLSLEEFNRHVVAGAHSIAALLMHLGEAERWWIEGIVEGKEAAEHYWARKYTDGMLEPEVFGQKNYSAQFCLGEIDEVREATRRCLSAFNDADLERIFTHCNHARTLEVSLRWVLHHLIEHEAEHKGQILMLKRLVQRQ